ncbi:MAG: hypothetical protein AAFR38_00885 [Planctomycetota bacterium]
MTTGKNDFYVGYLPMPKSHLRFLQIALPLTLLLAIGSGAAVATNRRAWGPGTWDLARAVDFEGTLLLEPYPILVTDDGALPIVGVAKVVPSRDAIAARGFDPDRPARAIVNGNLITRDGRRMISLALDETSIAPATGEPDEPTIDWIGTDVVTLAGEIVDSKCFLGAMKPGDGRTHKACATLCISGGVPPVLVTTDDTGAHTYFLLTDDRGRGLRPEAIEAFKPLIAEPVRVTGEFGRLAGWNILAIDPARIDDQIDPI